MRDSAVAAPLAPQLAANLGAVSEPGGIGNRMARSLRRRMTATEKFVWKQLRDRGACYKFRRQHPVAGYVPVPVEKYRGLPVEKYRTMPVELCTTCRVA